MSKKHPEPISDAALVVQDKRIRAIGKWDDIRKTAHFDFKNIIDLGEQVIFPGLINAHCHLDYTMMRRAIPPASKNSPKNFTQWIKEINALKSKQSLSDYSKAIQEGFKELKNHGTTTVFNIEAFPELLPHLVPPLIRTWWFYELIDIRAPIDLNSLVKEWRNLFKTNPQLGQLGLNPHAPYTASTSLFQQAQTLGKTFHLPLTTHLSESWDEHQLFTDASGPLYEFLTGLGKTFPESGHGHSALELLYDAQAIDSQWIIAHLNILTPTDFELLGPTGPLHGLNIVHCPLSHAYFNHPSFPFQKLQNLGANLCVGTDSLASNHSLSLFAELQQIARILPGISAYELLQMVTVNPAKAIGYEGRIGQLIPDAFADFIAIPLHDNAPTKTLTSDQLYESLLHFCDPINTVYLEGSKLLT